MNARFWKFAFVLLAVALALVMFFWPSANDDRLDIAVPAVDEQLESTSLTDVGTTTMRAPRFTGEDNKNRRWELKAKEARQSGALNPDNVWLDDIEAKATTEKGSEITFKAGEGEYLKEGSKLELRDGVLIEGYGFTLETEAVKSDLETRSAEGVSPVIIRSKEGEMSAQEFNITDHGSKIHLGGGVKGRFYPKHLNNDKKENKE